MPQGRDTKGSRPGYHTYRRSRTINTLTRSTSRFANCSNKMQQNVHLYTSTHTHILVACSIVLLLLSPIAYNHYSNAYVFKNHNSQNQDQTYQVWGQIWSPTCLHDAQKQWILRSTPYMCNLPPTHSTNYTRRIYRTQQHSTAPTSKLWTYQPPTAARNNSKHHYLEDHPALQAAAQHQLADPPTLHPTPTTKHGETPSCTSPLPGAHTRRTSLEAEPAPATLKSPNMKTIHTTGAGIATTKKAKKQQKDAPTGPWPKAKRGRRGADNKYNLPT